MVQVYPVWFCPMFWLELELLGQSWQIRFSFPPPQRATSNDNLKIYCNIFSALLSRGTLLRTTSQLTHKDIHPQEANLYIHVINTAPKPQAKETLKHPRLGAGHPVSCSHAICFGLWCHWLGSRGLRFVAAT